MWVVGRRLFTRLMASLIINSKINPNLCDISDIKKIVTSLRKQIGKLGFDSPSLAGK